MRVVVGDREGREKDPTPPFSLRFFAPCYPNRGFGLNFREGKEEWLIGQTPEDMMLPTFIMRRRTWGDFVRTLQIRQHRMRGIRLCPPSLISDITSVSGRSAPRGAPNAASAVRHTAFGRVVLHQMGVGYIRIWRSSSFKLSLTWLAIGTSYENSGMSPNQMRGVDYVKGTTLHTT